MDESERFHEQNKEVALRVILGRGAAAAGVELDRSVRFSGVRTGFASPVSRCWNISWVFHTINVIRDKETLSRNLVWSRLSGQGNLCTALHEELCRT